MNSTPAASKVSWINFKFPAVALGAPLNDSILLIVLTPTKLSLARVSTVQPSAARAIFICSEVIIDKLAIWQYLCHMTHFMPIIRCCLGKLEGAYASSTLRSYYADATAFVDWCQARNITPFPLTSATLRAYIDGDQDRYTYSSMRRRISGLRRVNAFLGHHDETRTEEVYLAIRRLKRATFQVSRQAAGINSDFLEKMIASQTSTLTGIRNRALLSVGYDFLARRSELVALRGNDIRFEPDGTLRGIIRRSKADQYGRGRLVFGSRRSAKLLRHWLKLKPRAIDAIFCAVNHQTCLDRALCDRSVNDIIKRGSLRVKGCEKPREQDLSGHSLRVGAAQDLLRGGHDLAAIMRAGGWSDAASVSRYIRYAEHNIWA